MQQEGVTELADTLSALFLFVIHFGVIFDIKDLIQQRLNLMWQWQTQKETDPPADSNVYRLTLAEVKSNNMDNTCMS